MGNGSVDNIKRNLFNQTEQLNKSYQKLSSGKRINSASDDAAGLAIADQLAADSVELSQGSRNISDASSVTNIQDGVYSSLGDISSRLSELATQSSNEEALTKNFKHSHKKQIESFLQLRLTVKMYLQGTLMFRLVPIVVLTQRLH